MSPDCDEAINYNEKKKSLNDTDMCKLKAQDAYLALVESSTDSMYLVDENCRYLFLNSQVLSRLGRPEGNIIGKSYGDFHSPEDTEIFAEIIKQVFKMGKSIQKEHHSKRDNRYFLRTYSPVREDDPDKKIKCVAVVSKDVTKLKQAEEEARRLNAELEQRVLERTAQLEAANKELESFSYSVSHDLRAPLRAIDGYARMILRKYGDKLNEDARAKFNIIRSSVHMMGQLIDDLLTFSHLSRKHISVSKIDMEALIGDVWKELQVINPDRNINLTIKSMPISYGDRALIKQAYSNLISNAIKFTKHRDPAVIEVGGYFDGNEDVYYVKDNGVGFDMQYYDKLFGVFQRLHSADEFEGTGVGLATVQRIINRHGGRVWAEGIIDQGACFYFALQRE